MPKPRLATCWALCAALVGCSGTADIPDTPDLRPIIAQFEQPSAALDQELVMESLQQMPKLDDLVAGFRATGYATTGVDEAGADAGQNSAKHVNIQGSLHVTVRCPGELAQPAFDSNGAIVLTLGVERNRIKRGVGGQASSCVLRGDVLGVPVRVALDGPFAFDLGQDLGLRSHWSGRLLMHLGGTLDVNGEVVRNFNARWDEDRMEFLFTLHDGSWIVAVVASDGSLSLRDKDSVWGCSDGQTCAKL